VKKLVALTLLFCLLVSLTACNSQGELKGNIFIVTNGAQNLKLGLVDVRVIPEKEMLAYMTAKKPQVDSRIAKITSEYQTAKVAFDAATKADAAASDRYNSEMQSDSREMKSYDVGDMSLAELSNTTGRLSEMKERVSDYGKAADEKRAETDTAQLRLAEAALQLKENSEPKLYFAGLPEGIAKATSNADGDFTLKMPSKGRFALAAYSQRQVFGSTEEYYWLIWVSLDGQPTKNILLGNQNLADAGSPDSVLISISAPVKRL
jgi:hypothetical protein